MIRMFVAYPCWRRLLKMGLVLRVPVCRCHTSGHAEAVNDLLARIQSDDFLETAIANGLSKPPEYLLSKIA